MTEVSYDLESYNRCLCGGCPVNRRSACVKQQEDALGSAFEAVEQGAPLPDPKVMPGIYCSVGKSACGDLQERLSCLCPGCSIHLSHDLRNLHYCLKGSAEEVG
jgi:hypothetical protein